MRPWIRRALSLTSACGIITVFALGSGCEGAQQTEYVAGVSTQVRVPRDLRTVRVEISVGGVNVFCRGYRVYDGKVQLPRSLGAFPVSADSARIAEPVTFTVTGFTEDLDSGNPLLECGVGTITPGENARILRRSRQPYVKDEILFLPIALRFSCFDKDCETGSGGTKTCKAGRCVDASTDPATLPPFSEDLVDGRGGNCFDTELCLGRSDANPLGTAPAAIVVNADDCTYAVAGSKDVPPKLIDDGAPALPPIPNWDGVNVEVIYDGGFNREILDKDPEEGFFVPDPAKPQQFRLAPGLCDMVKGVDPEGKPTVHRVTAVRAGGTCRAKSKFQPLCAEDQLTAMGVDPSGSTPDTAEAQCTPTQLDPAQAVLMVLVDDTENHSIFFTGKGDDQAESSGTSADSVLVNLALDDPAFARTDIGLSFYPGGTAPATCEATVRNVEPTISEAARDTIVTLFEERGKNEALLKPADTPVDLRRALDDAYTFLGGQKYANYYRRAVVVLGNRGFAGNAPNAECGGTPAERAGTAFDNERVSTYVVLLARDDEPPAKLPETELVPAQLLAQAGHTPGAYDARSDKIEAQNAFRQIVADLATCVYDGLDPLPNDVSLSYSDPVTGTTHVITKDAACVNDGAAANGWGQDAQNRIYLCGEACSTYRNVLRTAALFSVIYNQPPTAVPVFQHEPGCTPKK